MNLTDTQVENFIEKWREVFSYFLPKERIFENDLITILRHLPDDLDFDLLIRACDHAIMTEEFYPKLKTLFRIMDELNEKDIEEAYRRQEREAREKEERELQEHKARIAAMSPEEKKKLNDEMDNLLNELQASITEGTLDITVKADKDC